MKAKILKKLQADGKILLPSEIVDVSNWRNVKSLESNRYIALITHVSEEEPKKESKPKASKQPDAE